MLNHVRLKKFLASCTSVMMLAAMLGGSVSAASEEQLVPQAIELSDVQLQSTVADMPSNYKSSIEWVWNNRIVKEGSTIRKNLIFDQIYAGKGTINYVVRWQSSKKVTLKQRQDIEAMLSRQLNNWTKHLQGYDGWPYGTIPVKVVGWAVADPTQILDKQPNEIVYTDYIIDELSNSTPGIPSKLPVAPSSLSRFDHFTNPNYNYPGGLDKRFDMYLWATSNFGGGAGGDWGQRMSDDYILSTVNNYEIEIQEHEIGHGFGLPDFYGADERPPGGFPTPTIMWAGNSSTITSWDVWLLRYTWSQVKKDTTRFPGTPGNTDQTNVAIGATPSTSYVSSWETIQALNDGLDPAHSNDRTQAVYGNWPERGTQWVQYDFATNHTVSQVKLYWFKDGGGIDVPKSYKIQVWNGNSWVNVSNASGFGTATDQYNTTTFTPINTSKIRVEMVSQDNASTGILEWQVLRNQ